MSHFIWRTATADLIMEPSRESHSVDVMLDMEAEALKRQKRNEAERKRKEKLKIDERRASMGEFKKKPQRATMALGRCEGCGNDGIQVFLTDDGDFCEGCLAKMPWLRW